MFTVATFSAQFDQFRLAPSFGVHGALIDTVTSDVQLARSKPPPASVRAGKLRLANPVQSVIEIAPVVERAVNVKEVRLLALKKVRLPLTLDSDERSSVVSTVGLPDPWSPI